MKKAIKIIMYMAMACANILVFAHYASVNASEVPSSLDASKKKMSEARSNPAWSALENRPLVFPDNTVKLASYMTKRGEMAILGNALSLGTSLFFNKLNTEKGGLFGKYPVEFDVRDDKGSIISAIREVRSLVTKTPLFFSVLGSEKFSQALFPSVLNGQAVGFFPVTGGWTGGIREENNHVVFLRPTYADEVVALMDYAVNDLKKDKIALFYEDSEWGRQIRDFMVRELPLRGKKLVAHASYQPRTVDVSAAVSEIKKSLPDTVICASNGRPGYYFILKAMNAEMYGTSFLGISRMASMQDFLKQERGIDLVVSSIVPNPNSSECQIVKEYREDMQKYHKNKRYSVSSLEGYINAALFTHCAESLSENVTVGRFLESISSLNNYYFKGLLINHNSNTLSQKIWINDPRAEQWKEYEVLGVSL